MKNPVVCPHCQITVILMDDNSCPSCQKKFDEKVETTKSIETDPELKKAKKIVADKDSVFFFLPFFVIVGIVSLPVIFLIFQSVPYLLIANSVVGLVGLIQLFRWHSSCSYIFLICSAITLFYNFPYGIINSVFIALFSFDSIRVMKYSKQQIEDFRTKVRIAKERHKDP